MLGDSVVWGYGVHLNDTLGKQLEQILNKMDVEKKIEVINVAMAGLNTFQESHLLKTVGIKYNPDLIILAFVLNDSEGLSRFTPNKKEKEYVTINVLNDIKVPMVFKRTLKNQHYCFLLKID